MLAENSHFVSGGTAFFSAPLVSRSSLVCFPCWQSFLFLHAAGSVLRLRLSHKGPYSVMLQSLHPEGSSLYLPLSLAALFSLSLWDVAALIVFPVSYYFIPFYLIFFLNLFMRLLPLSLSTLHYIQALSLTHSLSLPPLTLTYFKWLLFPVYLSVFLYSFLALDDLVAKKIQILVVLPPQKIQEKKELKFTVNWSLQMNVCLQAPFSTFYSPWSIILKHLLIWHPLDYFASSGMVCEPS